MAIEAFIEWEPQRRSTAALLEDAQAVVDEYTAQGYQLTLRQLYYQLVARGRIPNQQRWYKRLGDVVSKARLAGLIDWFAIVDRGRVPVKPADWSSPSDILAAAANSYRLDRWAGQEHNVEVWCEKDALKQRLGTGLRTLPRPFPGEPRLLLLNRRLRRRTALPGRAVCRQGTGRDLSRRP